MKLGASDRWHFWYNLLTWVQVVSAFILTFVTISSKVEIPAGSTGLWYAFLEFFQDYALQFVVAGNAALWIAHALKRYFGYPLALETIKVLLEQFRNDVFKGEQSLTVNQDRVTLFRFKERRWRWGLYPSNDWLCTIERTGHMTRRKRKWFRACDDGIKFEGVAGAAYCAGKTILKQGLVLPDGNCEEAIAAYAKETFVNTAYVRQQIRKGAPLPKSLCAIIVEVKSKPWGVIVIDTSLAELADKRKIEDFYAKNAKVLGALLAVI